MLLGFRLLELRCHGRGAGVETNGQYHSDRIGQAYQIHACALAVNVKMLLPSGTI